MITHTCWSLPTSCWMQGTRFYRSIDNIDDLDIQGQKVIALIPLYVGWGGMEDYFKGDRSNFFSAHFLGMSIFKHKNLRVKRIINMCHAHFLSIRFVLFASSVRRRGSLMVHTTRWLIFSGLHNMYIQKCIVESDSVDSSYNTHEIAILYASYGMIMGVCGHLNTLWSKPCLQVYRDGIAVLAAK